MNIPQLIASLFRPAADLVDALHTSEEEKRALDLELQKVQLSAALQMLEFEKQVNQSKTDIIVAEAKGGGWLQRSWRPVTMLTFLFLVVADSYGWLANPLSENAWLILQVGIGGYIGGRSAEKIARLVMDKKE